MLPRELLYRDPPLLALRDSLGDTHTPVWYSTLAEKALGLQEPLTGAVLLSPELARQPIGQRRAILARELGKASMPKRRKRWWITAIALLLCLLFDIVLIRLRLPSTLRLADAGIATLCFWMAIWQFRSLNTEKARADGRQHIENWARERVPDYDTQLAAALTDTPIPQRR